ncbi:MAG: hypothetical protein IJB96_04380 [Lachnospira sp.]|nr:hypothetical protein [Lachnospira sp.]
MRKISLSYMLNRTFNVSTLGQCMWIFFCTQITAVTNGMIAEVLIMVSMAAFVALGAMLPKLPEEIFLMPVSREDREKSIRRLFVEKLIVSAILQSVLMIISVVCGFLTPISAVLLVVDAVTVSYAFVLTGYYRGKNVNASGIYTGTMMFIVILMVITAGVNVKPGLWAIIITINSVGLWSIVWCKAGKAIKGMCEDLADYEKLMVTNMPLDKRAKLKEKGVI